MPVTLDAKGEGTFPFPEQRNVSWVRLTATTVRPGGASLSEFIVGGSYGEGALLINDKPVAYYSTTSGSIGLQAGYQESSVVYMFMTDEALQKFRESSGLRSGH